MKLRGYVFALAMVLFVSTYLEAREYQKQERAQSRGFSPGVVTEGGKIDWVSGQTGLVDEQGRLHPGAQGLCGRQACVAGPGRGGGRRVRRAQGARRQGPARDHLGSARAPLGGALQPWLWISAKTPP